MKILFLSHYFPPEVNAPAIRTFEHANRWVKMGHEVTVLTCTPHHPIGVVYPGYENKLRLVEYKDGVKVVRLLTYVTSNQGFAGRTFNYIFYMIMTILAAPFLGKFDLVISTSPQFFNGLAGYLVSGIKRSAWLLEVRDLWPDSILAVGAVKNKVIMKILEGLERFVYRKADAIVSVTDSFVPLIEERGATNDKIHVIKNGCDVSQFQPVPPDVGMLKELGLENKFVISYVGTLGMAHGLETLLDAANLLRDHEDIEFLIVGDGAQRINLEEKLSAEKLTNVRLMGLQPKELMPSILSISNVSVVLLRKFPLFKTVIPSKIFESMAMSKPILLAVEGESAAIVESSGAGLTVEPENSQALADSVLRLKTDALLYKSLCDNGPEYVSEYHDRSKLASEYALVLDNVVERYRSSN